MTHFDDVFVFSCLVVSHSLRPQALQHARLPTVLHHLQSLLKLIPLMMYATAQLLCERHSPFLGRRALGTWGKGQSSADSGRRRACLQVNAPACDTRVCFSRRCSLCLPWRRACGSGGRQLGRMELRVWCFWQESASKMGDFPVVPEPMTCCFI